MTMATGGQTAASGGQTTASGGRRQAAVGKPRPAAGRPRPAAADGGDCGRTASSGGQTTASGGRQRRLVVEQQAAVDNHHQRRRERHRRQVHGTGGASTGGSAGSTGASGAGVTINGKFVPRDKAVVFIHFGHSNMRGAATTPTSLNSYFFNTVDGLWSYKASFTLAKEPTAPQAGYTSAGPGMAILHSAQSAVAATSDVQFISVGYGQGSATTVDYQKSGSYYPIFMGWAGQLKGTSPLGRSSSCWGDRRRTPGVQFGPRLSRPA